MYTVEYDETQPDDFIERMPTQPQMERVNLLTAPIPALLRRFHVDTLPSVDSYQTARVVTPKKAKHYFTPFERVIILISCLLISLIVFFYLSWIYLVLSIR